MTMTDRQYAALIAELIETRAKLNEMATADEKIIGRPIVALESAKLQCTANALLCDLLLSIDQMNERLGRMLSIAEGFDRERRGIRT